MAVTKAIPQLWSARILEGFIRNNVWASLATDISSELAAGGNQIHLIGVTTTVTVDDYTVNTDISDPQNITDSDTILMVDQQKYFNIQVDDVDRVQSRPDLLNHFSILAGRQVAITTDEFMRGIWVPDAVRTTNDAARRFMFDASTNLGDSPTSANLRALVARLNNIVKSCDDEDWPNEGRWMVVNNQVLAGLRLYLVDAGVIGSGDINNSAVVDGAVNRLFGMRVLNDKNIPDGANANDLLAAVGHSSGVYWASQIRRVEAYRPEKRFADAIKGLFVYGAKKVNDAAIKVMVETS